MTVLTVREPRPRLDARRADGPGAIALLVAVHLAFLAAFFAPAISTPDANGYLAQARLIARQGRTDIEVESPAQYVGDHWMSVAPGRYFGQYPPGLPAMIAVVFRPFGPLAALWVIPVLGSLSLLGLYLVVRVWVGRGWALLAGALMAVNPFANQHAMGADSHTAVGFFLIWALYAWIRWERSRAAGWMAVVGVCLGVIPSIRYAEALFLVPFAVIVVLSPPRDGRWWRSVAAGVLCASVPLAALAIRNQTAFGAFWRTGYSVSGEQTGFGIGYFVRHAVPFLVMLLIMGVGIVFPVGVKGLIELSRRPDTRREGQLLAALIVPITLLYMAYYWHADSHSMRFLLPTFPLYTIAAVWLLKLQGETDPERARRWGRIVLGVTLAWGLPYSTFALSRLRSENRALAEVTRAIARHVPPGSIVIAQGGVQQHLDFVGDWRLAPEEGFERDARPARPVGPDRDESRPPPSALTPAERTGAFRREIGRWAGASRQVFWLTTEARLAAVRDRLEPGGDTFTPIAEVRVTGRPGPPPPPRGPKGERGGPGPRGTERAGPPAHFEPPDDGKFLLVGWTIREPGIERDSRSGAAGGQAASSSSSGGTSSSAGSSSQPSISMTSPTSTKARQRGQFWTVPFWTEGNSDDSPHSSQSTRIGGPESSTPPGGASRSFRIASFRSYSISTGLARSISGRLIQTCGLWNWEFVPPIHIPPGARSSTA